MPEAEPSSSAHSYEVLGKLAEGGLTEIFLARAKGAGAVERFVVLKRLKRTVATQVDLVKLFLDEARLASQLQHPNIAQVFEVGKLGGSYFFAMEFVNGETLQALMLHARTRKIQVPVRAVLTIAAAVAAGLHHAHDRAGTDGQALHIVHGEVSPTNTLVSQEGIVKLVDFGIARAGETAEPKVGPYSSPEQCGGGPLDRRSDLFSLGVVLWELLTLDSLYHRATDAEVKAAIEGEEPAKPSAKRYDVPPELDAMVMKLLAKNPADRFQDADEVLAEIEALAQKLSILLSTADLSRMMRLWFGTKSEPAPEEASEPVAPLLVSSEEIPDDLAVPVESPIDDQLDAVRSAAALIVARATERSSSPTGRPYKAPTVPPELMDNPNENFEQIRDRILARARQKKETQRNQILGATSPPADGGTAAAAADARASGGAEPDAGPADRSGAHGDRHTRTTAQAPIVVIEEALRMSGRAEPVVTKPANTNGVNGRLTADSDRHSAASAVEPYTPDKVVVDEEIRGSQSTSGELDAKSSTSGELAAKSATSGASENGRDAKLEAARAYAEAAAKADVAGTIVSGREAPPASANVATVSSSTGAAASASDTAAKADAADAPRDAEQPVARARRASAAQRDRDTAGRDVEPGRRDADRGDTDERARRDEVVYARASTAEILRRPPPRPAWMVPALGGAVVLVLVLIVAVLRSDDDSPDRAHANLDRDTPARTQAAPGSSTVRSAAPPATATTHVVAAAPANTAASAVPAGSAAEVTTQEGSGATSIQASNGSGDTTTATGGPPAAKGASHEQVARDGQVASTQPVGTPAKQDGATQGGATKEDGAAPGGSKEGGATQDGTKHALASKQDSAKQGATRTPKPDDDGEGAPKKAAAAAKKAPAPAKGIEELYAAGDFASTNTACTKEIVFTAQKLDMCASAACETKNAPLAKRWIKAIRAASRPPLVEKCRANGVELEAPAPAPAPPPAAPSPDAAPTP